jgi:hypothetical protein
MTTLTMEQRRSDFETMLKRADLARVAMPQCLPALTDTGGPLALIARDVSELCAAWAESAYRARTHKPSDQAQARARIVAARCLLLLDDIGVADPVKEVVDASVDEALGPLTWREDLHVPAVERIGRLLSYLGDVAENYDYGTDDGCRLVIKDVTALLAAKAICAALAAERGLWQEEES